MEQHMGNQRCINGILEGGNYSSPVPIIGLYTAGASSACLLMMLYDIATGLRARKRWLPCRSFSLNSFTLSLLSISAKLPVDLTTAMPSDMDQLSKLSGTTLVVIAIGFTFPSMGKRNQANWIPNFAALAIFVATVVVNICIQISTGVIVLFIPEHIVILFSMVSLLIWMWGSLEDHYSMFDHNYDLMAWGEKSMFQRIKICYANAYKSSIQFVMCKQELCAGFSTGFSGVCLICTLTLIQAAVRALILKQLDFCSGTSDYDWSMQFIVITQIIAVLLGGFATTFRWISMHPLVNKNFAIDILSDVYDLLFFMLEILFDFDWRVIFLPIALPLYFLAGLVWFLPKLLMHGLGYFARISLSFGICNGRVNENRMIEEFVSGEYDDKWILRKNIAKMNMVIAKCEKPAPIHLMELLARIPQSKQLEVRVIDTQLTYPLLRKEDVSYHQLVILVSLVRVSIPDHLSATLLQAYDEVDLILGDLERLVNPDRHKLFSVQAKGYGFKDGLKNFSQHSSDLDRAIAIFTGSKDFFAHYGPYHMNRGDELGVIIQLISPTTHSSIEDLCSCIEQLFVDMLHGLVAQLPVLIFKLLNEEFLENYESKVEAALRIFCRAEHLETHIQWLFPKESNITTLMRNEPLVTEIQSDNLEQGNVSVNESGVNDVDSISQVHNVVTIHID